MSIPFVSFLCPTFGRPPFETHLLNEKIYWFTQMAYPSDLKELIILSDAYEQELKCDVKGVRVINHRSRFKTLGDQRNALMALAKGDILLNDDDDDISLPHRAVQAYEKLAICDYYDPGARWYQEGSAGSLVNDPKNNTHHASCYRKGKFIYDSTSGDEDQKAVEFLSSPHNGLFVIFDKLTKNKDLSYIYRWGVSRNHISGKGKEGMQRYFDDKKAVPGKFELVPIMGRNYVHEISFHS